jgi:hypothetical protein
MIFFFNGLGYDRIMFEENDERRRDCICYGIQSFIIFVLISIIVYFVWLLFRMIETMTFVIRYE